MNITEQTIDDNWYKILQGHTSFKEMTRGAKHLMSIASEGTASAIQAYVFEQAKRFNGVMLGADITRNNKAMRAKLAEEYGLTLEHLQQLEQIIDKKGGVFCLNQDSSSGTVELTNPFDTSN